MWYFLMVGAPDTRDALDSRSTYYALSLSFHGGSTLDGQSCQLFLKVGIRFRKV